MGVIYSVCPLDVDGRDLLLSYGVTGGPWPDGRNPRVSEIRRILDGLSEFEADYDPSPSPGRPWGVLISHRTRPDEAPWAHLCTLNYDPTLPTEIYFEKGWPELIVRIVVALAEVCGSLCVFPDTGEAPLVAHPGSNAETLLATWEHTSSSQRSASGGTT